MKHVFTLIFVATICSFGYAQSTASATFSGLVPTYSYSYNAACNADDTLQVAVPAGSLVVGIDISYSMTATGGGWMVEQQSRIECLTTGNTELAWYPGSGYSGGTYNYSRTGVNIANGISNGSYTFRMQAYRTYGSGGCTTTYNYVTTGSWNITVHYCPGSPPFLPILNEDTLIGSCGSDSLSITANPNYSAYSWSNGSTDSTATFYHGGQFIVQAIDSACPYADTVDVSLVSTNVSPIDTTVCEGEVVALDGYNIAEDCIEISSFGTTNSQVFDHNAYSGDDRGGIAITPNYFYYVGDNYTVRADASNLGNPVSLPQRDGIFSDLGSGRLYTLWSSSGSFSSTNINQLVRMDEDLNLGEVIPLTQTINAGSYSMVAPGSGFVIIWANNNDHFYHIDLFSGVVTDLGSGNILTTANPGVSYYNSENWAKWGIAECDSAGGYTVVGRAYYWNGSYVYSPSRMIRYYINGGATEEVTAFSSSVSDMACFTYSPWHSRWYFHHEGSSVVFGGGAETGGYADITASGGGQYVPIFNYAWSNGDSTKSIDVSPSQTTDYTVSVYDGINTCLDSATVNIIEAPAVSFNITDVACKYDSTGSISATVTNGSGPYIYGWDTGDSTSSLSMLPDGSYILTTIDTLGCTSIDTAEVTEPVVPFAPIIGSVSDAHCFGEASGSGTVLAAGGDAPYSFLWSNGGTSSTDNNLPAGTVMVTVSDARGCEFILSDSLDQPDEFFHNLDMTGTVCSGDETGEVTSAGAGGTPPYAYNWSTGSTSSDDNNVGTGFHTLTVSDANGCMYVDSIEVTFQFASPEVPLAEVNTICDGYTLVLDAGPNGTSYLWSTSEITQTITISTAGIYKVTVTNGDGCETEARSEVDQATCVGVSEVEALSIKLYPNPTDGMINIETNGAFSNTIDVQIVDISGRVVKTLPNVIQANAKLSSIDVSGEAVGTYFLRLISDNTVVNVTPISIR